MIHHIYASGRHVCLSRKSKSISTQHLSSNVVYICSISWLLADKWSDLSQAEKKITVAKSKQIQKMATILHKLTTFDHSHFVNLHRFDNSYFLLCLRWIMWFMSQQPKTDTDVEHLSESDEKQLLWGFYINEAGCRKTVAIIKVISRAQSTNRWVNFGFQKTD